MPNPKMQAGEKRERIYNRTNAQQIATIPSFHQIQILFSSKIPCTSPSDDDPAPRDKTRKVYPSLKGSKTSTWDIKVGVLMHAQADLSDA
jgi:hypothetical protein